MKKILFFIFLSSTFIFYSQTVETFATPGSYTWVCPANVTQVRVQCWGGGDRGQNGGVYCQSCRNGGNGGGYSESILKVSPGITYYLMIGKGGLSIQKPYGECSWFNSDSLQPINNSGVLTVNFYNPNGQGQIINKGGIGQNRDFSTMSGGGGGSCASYNNNGVNGIGYTGGKNSNNKGNGGDGAEFISSFSFAGNGKDGASPGGGGGGGAYVDNPYNNTPQTSYGGNGADGQIILNYTPDCTSTQTAFIPLINPISSCGTFQLSATNVSSFLGLEYQWQMSIDTIKWTNLPNNKQISYYQSTEIDITYYRVISKCIYSKIDSLISKNLKHVLNSGYLKKGKISNTQNICKGDSYSNITLTGSKGSLQWQKSTDLTSWIDIVNANDSALLSSKIGTLTSTTYFRAKISSSICGNLISDIVTISVSQKSNAGKLYGDQNICESTPITDLYLSSQIGENFIWQISDDTLNWYIIPNVTDSKLISNQIDSITNTSYFRVLVKNNLCDYDTSNFVKVNVIQNALPGILSKNQDICQNNQIETLKLSSARSNHYVWQYTNSSDTSNQTVWINFGGDTDSLTSKNIGSYVGKKYFRCLHYYIFESICPKRVSNIVTINISKPSFGGNTTSDQTICEDTYPSPISLSSSIGNSIYWQKSTDNINWENIPSSDSNKLILNGLQIGFLQKDTYIRASVKNGTCPYSFSTARKITVNNLSIAGEIDKNQIICTGNKPIDINLRNYNGSINWQYAKPNSIVNNNWYNITSTDPSKLLGNTIGILKEKRFIRAQVTNGMCQTVNSEIDTIYVSPLSVAGSISTNQLICSGTYPTDISITGGIGNLTWQKSTNANTWSDIPNSFSSILSSNIAGIVSNPTYYRGVQTSGTCPSVYTPIMTVNIDSVSYAGATSSNQSLCTGTSSSAVSVTKSRGSLQWQSSTNGVTFNDIANATSTSYQPGLLANTTYYRMQSISGVCSAAYSTPIQITISPKSITGTLSFNQTICSGTQPSDINISNPNGTISWQSSLNNTSWSTIFGASGTTLTSAQMGNLTSRKYYRATVKSGACTSVTSNSVSIGIRSNPIVSGGSNLSICPNTSISLSGSGAVSYVWSNGVQNNISFTPSSTKTYSVTGTDASGCTGTSQVTVIVYPTPTVQISSNNPVIICQGTPFNLTSSATNVSSYQWKLNGNLLNGSTNSLLNSKIAGNYSLEVQSINGCKAESNILSIQTKALPSIEAGNNQTICLGDKIQLLATKATDVHWTNGIQNGDTVSPTISSTYKVTTSDNNGCSNSDSVEIIVNYPTSSSFNTTSFGDFLFNNQLYSKSGTYTQIIPNKAGCDSTITLNLVVENLGLNNLEDEHLKIYPNPTPDGKFSIHSEYEIDEIQILNSNGKVLETLKNENKIDISRFGRGVYFVELNTSGGKLVLKVFY